MTATPPRAERRPTTLTAHGEDRVDDWHWLRERDNPEVRAHLERENAHTGAALAHLDALRSTIFSEIRGRVRESDTSAPIPDGPWEYYRRTEAGREHGIYCRRPRAEPSAEVVLLDVNALAAGHPFCSIGDMEVSPDHRLLAYTVDFSGDERYDLHVLDCATRANVDTVVRGVYYGLAWANDAATLWYVRPDATVRPHQVWRHRVGTAADDDVLIHDEIDERFFVHVRRCRDGEHALIASRSKTTGEALLLSTTDPEQPPWSPAQRRDGVDWSLEPLHDRWFTLTNENAPDFRVLEHPDREVHAEVTGVRRRSLDAFANHLVTTERADGVLKLRVLRLSDGFEYIVGDSEQAGSVELGPNRELDTTTVRIHASSLVHPLIESDFDLDTQHRTVVRTEPVEGDYDPSRFVAERVWATAPDGIRVPISVARPAHLPLDGSSPLLLYGYGSYEISIDPWFSHSRLSLMERGVTFAIAHVRGGGELGRSWYETGKLERKANSFSDFVACAEHLVGEGYTSPERLVARGRSAGGLLMGAIANLRPDLFRAIVAEVPFVDPLTTIQDASLPLTITEWDEWGNPLEDPAIYAAMRAYSPYDNVRRVDYPAILATAGLNDSRVQYWEPAKWVLKLRDATTSTNPILLRCEMEAGHSGPSGRYELWREEAFVLAFVLDQLGMS